MYQRVSVAMYGPTHSALLKKPLYCCITELSFSRACGHPRWAISQFWRQRGLASLFGEQNLPWSVWFEQIIRNDMVSTATNQDEISSDEAHD